MAGRAAANTNGMSTQPHDEAAHPRETSGKFTTKPVTEAMGGLDAFGRGPSRAPQSAAAYTAELVAALPEHPGLRVAVEGTGGGCQALVIRMAGAEGAMYVTDGNLDVDFGGEDDTAVWYADEDDEATEILPDASAGSVAQAISRRFGIAPRPPAPPTPLA